MTKIQIKEITLNLKSSTHIRHNLTQITAILCSMLYNCNTALIMQSIIITPFV